MALKAFHRDKEDDDTRDPEQTNRTFVAEVVDHRQAEVDGVGDEEGDAANPKQRPSVYGPRAVHPCL